MSTILSILFPVLSIMAGYDGRYYSVRNHNGISSPGMTVFCGIIGIILAVLLIVVIIKDEKQGPQDKGCLTTFFVAMIVISIIAIISKCS